MDIVVSHQLNQPLRRNHSEITARNHGRRVQLTREKGRSVIKIEGQTDKMLRHCSNLLKMTLIDQARAQEVPP
jgi:hypothetical protein